MPFNTALSGIRAASKDLSVTGNNIANASTTGFKSSRAEFGDLYASSILGSGANPTGSGVRLQDVAQNFKEGSISFTESNLDLAISGSGFFTMSRDGEQFYSRAGTFGLDKNGFIVNNSGAVLQGYAADSAGNIGGLRTDLRIETSNLAPRQTTHVQSELNLDASEPVVYRVGTSLTTAGTAIGVAQTDIADLYTSYAGREVSITAADGTTTTYTSSAAIDEPSAKTIAAELNGLPGISATASTTMEVTGDMAAGTATFSLNGVDLDASSLEDLAQQINSNANLASISARISASGLTISSSTGEHLSLGAPVAVGNLAVRSADGSPDTSIAGNTVSVGGSVSLVLDEGFSVASADTEVFGVIDETTELATSVINAFNPADPQTYNSATTMQVYDSLGNPHVMTQYFVRQKYDPSPDSNTEPNHWQMHVQIDGKNVGDPLSAAELEARGLGEEWADVPTMATFDMYFSSDGVLDEERSEDVLISNWTPLDANGQPNGALGPETVAEGASTLLEDPPTSSNFVMDFTGTTQFNDEFGEYNVAQNGYTTGRLSAMNIDEQGLIFARFTNGQSQALGQIVLAKFTNEQGLDPAGDTMWSESAESGQPKIGTPGSSDLGSIQSGALEESNVDLSAQLVNLIIAQRNFQANAKTIETADQTTQTIINLR